MWTRRTRVVVLPPELAAADAAIRRALDIRGGRRRVKRKVVASVLSLLPLHAVALLLWHGGESDTL